MNDVPNIFGSMVFNDLAMKGRLPKDTYQALRKTVMEATPLDLDVANVVASAMKDWAIEKGATHFTHWFQPMTGITAEKHDSFISPQEDGTVIMEFSGKALVQGEPDASSFPSGGLRATFEARGYTAWDSSAYAFIKNGILCIPTAFCSYCGEALDKKTPLLRSMEALNTQALRVLKLFGNHSVCRVTPVIGIEQEYFLVDKELYGKRRDLMYTGRTLFGSRPPKGQEMEDHYFGVIRHQVSEYMKELDEELWKLGILAKTKHNEVAPSQHELASVYTSANLSSDQNQLTMELMKSIASRHGLVCLLHEKPFAGINGSGKHNNWSLSTDAGNNLLEPGITPHENAQFLLFLMAVIKAVDQYQGLLRMSTSSAGNDHRLGANEAPPAIVSVFIGDELSGILESIDAETPYNGVSPAPLEIGASVLPHFPRDATDRNRTSPFAFTGNKFEFRMVGSALSVAGPNIVINTIVAETLSDFADKLEKAASFEEELRRLLKKTIGEHNRIIFNGNSYDEEWTKEAEKRGLLNLKSTPEALSAFVEEKSIHLFVKHKVFSQSEIHSRYEILLESYGKTINIEALTLLDIATKEIVPSVVAYESQLLDLLIRKTQSNLNLSTTLESSILDRLSRLSECLYNRIGTLSEKIAEAKGICDSLASAISYREKVLSAMNDLRLTIDELELIVSQSLWPVPTYADMLYQVEA